MKKLIISGIGVLSLILVFAFQPPENNQPTELTVEMPDVQKEIQAVQAKDFKAGNDGVLDFDDRMF